MPTNAVEISSTIRSANTEIKIVMMISTMKVADTIDSEKPKEKMRNTANKPEIFPKTIDETIAVKILRSEMLPVLTHPVLWMVKRRSRCRHMTKRNYTTKIFTSYTKKQLTDDYEEYRYCGVEMRNVDKRQKEDKTA